MPQLLSRVIHVLYLFWKVSFLVLLLLNVHDVCDGKINLCVTLKADRPHPHNYLHTPADYRHTDKHWWWLLMLFAALGKAEPLANYLPVSRSIINIRSYNHVMLNPIEKFKSLILHLNRDWNHWFLNSLLFIHWLSPYFIDFIDWKWGFPDQLYVTNYEW